MNIKLFEQNLKSVQDLTPEAYKDTMKVTVPFFLLHKEVFSQGEKLLKEEFFLNQSELDILTTLFYMTNKTYTMSPTNLYDYMLFTSGGMTKILKKLETKEYITRISNNEDKRGKLVKLTPLGIQTAKSAVKQLIELEDNYISKISKEEKELFTTLIFKMLN